MNKKKYRRVLCVCATEDEFLAMKKTLKDEHITHKKLGDSGYLFIRSEDTKFFIAKCGITYFAAPLLGRMIQEIKPDFVYNFGTCAGIAGQDLYSVIISNNCFSNDLDLTAFDYLDGTTLKRVLPNAIGDPIISGSRFLSTKEEKEKVLKRFPGAVAFDMETYAYRECCFYYGIPFLSIRGVSDNGEEHPSESYATHCERAGQAASRALLRRELLI